MPDAPDSQIVTLDTTILLLAMAGAGVDAAIILGFDALTAAQTGNTILLAASLAEGRFVDGLNHGVSVLGYIVGAAAGELVIIEQSDSEAWPSALRRAMLAELVLLGCLLVGWRLAGSQPAQEAIIALVALAAIAMGIQSVAVLRLHAGPTTTYITGMLTTLTTELVRSLRPVESAPTPSTTRQHRGSGARASGGRLWRYGATWIVYFAAAVLTGVVFLRGREIALLLPIAAIIAVIARTASRAANGRHRDVPFGRYEG